MSTAIKIENLWKQYRLGVIGHQYLVKDVQSWWARVRGEEDPNTPLDKENSGNGVNPSIWALREISLEVEEGEVLGIIGQNGAGKSTLLKILTRVTAPTKGSVKMRGRVTSLLEVGTGFHPELTGRENVFLNGTILGMSLNEVKRKFDQILDFSGVEKFIDTPVKRYSSGMYVRLAFAIAAHLDSEILILDEVLAVGDAEFQNKCMGKMDQVANQGRTVLFVSHGMSSIRRLCPTSMLLDHGKIIRKGSSDEIVSFYLGLEFENSCVEYSWDEVTAPKNDCARIRAIRVRAASGEIRSDFAIDEPVLFEVEYTILRNLHSFHIGISLYTADGTYLLHSSDEEGNLNEGQPRITGTYLSQCTVPPNLLNCGSYYVVVSGGIAQGRMVFQNLPRLSFNVLFTGDFSSRTVERKPGVIAPKLMWKIR
jgi:lipopolysaccharide transport system ATP-binding protein